MVLPQPRPSIRKKNKDMVWRWPGKIISFQVLEKSTPNCICGGQPDGRLSVGQGGKRQNFGFHGLIGEVSGSSRSDADSCLVFGLKSYYERPGSRGGNDQGSICDLLMERGGMVRDRDVPWFYRRRKVSN